MWRHCSSLLSLIQIIGILLLHMMEVKGWKLEVEVLRAARVRVRASARLTAPRFRDRRFFSLQQARLLSIFLPRPSAFSRHFTLPVWLWKWQSPAWLRRI